MRHNVRYLPLIAVVVLMVFFAVGCAPGPPEPPPGRSTYAFIYEVPEFILVGEGVEVPVTFKSTVVREAGYEGVIFEFQSVGPGDVTFRVTDEDDVVYIFTKSGSWGGPDGFDLPAEYEVTTEVMLTFPKFGEYGIFFKLVKVDTGESIVSGFETMEVQAAKLNSIDPDDTEGTEGYTRFAGKIDVGAGIGVNDISAYYFFEIIDGDIDGKPQYWDENEEVWRDFADEGNNIYRFGPLGGFDLKGVDGSETQFQVKIDNSAVNGKAYVTDADTGEVISNILEETVEK